jgi:hypothetical protein
MKKTMVVASLVLFVGVLFFEVFANDVWQKFIIRDEWGDERKTNTYSQALNGEGVSKIYTGGEPWMISLQWDEGTDSVFLSIRARMLDLETDEAWACPVGLVVLDEKVNVALRDSNSGAIQNFSGILSEKRSTVNHALMLIKSKDIVFALKKDAKYTMLITGNDWRVRAAVVGGLPAK